MSAPMRKKIPSVTGMLFALLVMLTMLLGCGKPADSSSTDSTSAADEFTLVGEVVD
jgi:hypothetical protein